MTVNPEAPASRLIAGWTFGRPGGRTSWPPHQHEQDLEEVYAYFDMPPPLRSGCARSAVLRLTAAGRPSLAEP
jgi:5-deoxy-D-glucuronate isomerase